MTGEQSRTLGVGERVCWHSSLTDLGTVVETTWSGVTIDRAGADDENVRGVGQGNPAAPTNEINNLVSRSEAKSSQKFALRPWEDHEKYF
jgi:hypothetical protein